MPQQLWLCMSSLTVALLKSQVLLVVLTASNPSDSEYVACHAAVGSVAGKLGELVVVALSLSCQTNSCLMSYFTTIETGTCTCSVDPSMMLSTSLTWWGPTILGMCIHLSHCDWSICLMPLAAFLDLANMVEGTTVWSRSCRGQVTMTRFASPVALTVSPKVANFLLK